MLVLAVHAVTENGSPISGTVNFLSVLLGRILTIVRVSVRKVVFQTHEIGLVVERLVVLFQRVRQTNSVVAYEKIFFRVTRVENPTLLARLVIRVHTINIT